ncbi:MAG: ATP-binding protein [Thiotrichales bacterium]|nr:ATP-binding protein [Thiotrichales bacterium]
MPKVKQAEKLLELRFQADADRLCLIRPLVKRVAEVVGCQCELADQLVLAVNEACMNVIQHAYKGDSGEIILEILNNKKKLLFRLKDFAAPVDLDSIHPRELDDIRPGGLGTHFIREIMDECEMGHLEDRSGNYIEMTKRIS